MKREHRYTFLQHCAGVAFVLVCLGVFVALLVGYYNLVTSHAW